MGSEAAFHKIDEYMSHVEDYFLQLEKLQKVDQRRVYIASDDPEVFNEVKNK